MTDHGAEARYRANLQGEVDSAALYQTLAQAETNPDIAKVYSKLAAIEDVRSNRSDDLRRRLRDGVGDARL